jgi:DNA-directed RNA polymerase specialized sigma24 family protein
LSLTAGRNPSKDDKQFDSIMAEIADEEKVLAELRQQLLNLQQEIEGFIDSLDQKDHRVFLRLMYIRGRSMKEIRSIMALPKTTCFNLQKKALREAEKKLQRKKL